MTARISAWVAAVVLVAVTVFQITLVAGAPWGEFTQGGGSPGALPPAGRFVAGVSAVILLGLAFGLLGRVGVGPAARLRPRLLAVVTWVAVGWSALAVLLNAATPSPGERAVFLPVSLVLLAATLTEALATRGGPRP
jgi:hypothetical protein